MPRHSRRRSKKAGLLPGSLIFTGERRHESLELNVMEFRDSEVIERVAGSIQELTELRDSGRLFWLQVTGLSQVEKIAAIGRVFHLHPLVQEDIVNTTQRPKVEEIEHGLFFDFNLPLDTDSGLHTEQLSLVLGPHYVLSFQERPYEFFTLNRLRLRQEIERLPHPLGPDHLLYILQDSIVDRCFVTLEDLEDKLETLEESLIDNPAPRVQKDIYHLKRDLTLFRKSVWPLRDIFNRLLYGGLGGVEPRTAIYFRDLHDHVIQIMDTVESLRDMVAGMLDIYLSSVSNRMNQVMKVLTVISTIFIPLTFIAGVYGMNFDHMPELHWKLGYPLIWLVMVLIGGIMVWNFRRRDWF